jgi:hypothetical protein
VGIEFFKPPQAPLELTCQRTVVIWNARYGSCQSPARGVTARGRGNRAAVGSLLDTHAARGCPICPKARSALRLAPAGSDEVSERVRDGGEIARFRPKVYTSVGTRPDGIVELTEAEPRATAGFRGTTVW